MARRRPRFVARVEPPVWYRFFDLAAWDEPDAHEQAMIDGSLAPPEMWPAELHEIHAERRWAQAKYEYRRVHPLLAEQEFAEIRARHAARRG